MEHTQETTAPIVTGFSEDVVGYGLCMKRCVVYVLSVWKWLDERADSVLFVCLEDSKVGVEEMAKCSVPRGCLCIT